MIKYNDTDPMENAIAKCVEAQRLTMRAGEISWFERAAQRLIGDWRGYVNEELQGIVSIEEYDDLLCNDIDEDSF